MLFPTFKKKIGVKKKFRGGGGVKKIRGGGGGGVENNSSKFHVFFAFHAISNI